MLLQLKLKSEHKGEKNVCRAVLEVFIQHVDAVHIININNFTWKNTRVIYQVQQQVGVGWSGEAIYHLQYNQTF